MKVNKTWLNFPPVYSQLWNSSKYEKLFFRLLELISSDRERTKDQSSVHLNIQIPTIKIQLDPFPSVLLKWGSKKKNKKRERAKTLLFVLHCKGAAVWIFFRDRKTFRNACSENDCCGIKVPLCYHMKTTTLPAEKDNGISSRFKRLQKGSAESSEGVTCGGFVRPIKSIMCEHSTKKLMISASPLNYEEDETPKDWP